MPVWEVSFCGICGFDSNGGSTVCQPDHSEVKFKQQPIAMMTKMEAKKHWDVWGHDWAVQMLQQHIVSHSVRHAYLVTGVDGIGKRTLALAFAQALNCPQTKEGVPCGACRICNQIQEMKDMSRDLMILVGNRKQVSNNDSSIDSG